MNAAVFLFGPFFNVQNDKKHFGVTLARLKGSADKSLHQNIALSFSMGAACRRPRPQAASSLSVSAALGSPKKLFSCIEFHANLLQKIEITCGFHFCGGVSLKELTASGNIFWTSWRVSHKRQRLSKQLLKKSLQNHPANIWMTPPPLPRTAPTHSPMMSTLCFANTDQILQEDDSTSKMLTAFIRINTEPVWN